MSTITIVPASGAITAAKTVCRVTLAAFPINDSSAFSGSAYPTEPEIRYYISFLKSSVEYGRSYVFGVDSTGGHVFNNYIFPSSGTWSVSARKVSDNSEVVAISVTVA